MELKEIEQKFDVQSLTSQEDMIWPLLRLKLNEEIRKTKNIESRTFKLTRNTIFRLLVTSVYGFKNLFSFRNYEYWVFSSSERRKKNQKGVYEDRVIGFMSTLWKRSLIIENPYPLGNHYPKNETYPDKIISQTGFSLAAKIISYFLRNRSINNEQLLHQIYEATGCQINHKRIIKEVRAQYLLTMLMLWLGKPKMVFFVYSASCMGYIKALKENGIPVVEMQHGIINTSHNAYNLHKDFGTEFFPDYLLTYGKKELEIFNEGNYFIEASKVVPMGYYFLEMSKKAQKNITREKSLRNKFEKIVVVSLQDPFDTFYFEFLDQVASLNGKVCYLIVPRNPQKSYAKFHAMSNLIIEKELNIYECLHFADYHCTINSTCAIESLYFGVPNILYDYSGWATNYYATILGDAKHTIFVESAEQFVEALDNWHFYSREEIKNAGNLFFEDNFLQNVTSFVET